MSPASALRTVFRGSTMLIRRLTSGTRPLTFSPKQICTRQGSFSTSVLAPVLSRSSRSLLYSKGVSNHAIAAAGANLAEEPANGSPEAPPQTPPELKTVPGTDVPVEEVIVPEKKVPFDRDAEQSTLSTDKDKLVAEVVDEVPSASAAAGDVGSVQGSSEANATAAAKSPQLEEFNTQWTSFIERLKEKDFYQDMGDDGTPMSGLGAVKKATLMLGRSRQDIFFALDSAELARFVIKSEETKMAGALRDRKCVNALERLKASLIDNGDLPIGRGGAADFLDVCRVFFAIYSESMRSIEAAPSIKPELYALATKLLGDVAVLVSKEPSAEAAAKAEAAAAQKLQQEAESAALRVEKKRARRDSDGNLYTRSRGDEGWGRAPSAPYIDNRRPTSNFKQGDWICTDCSAHNFARNAQCFSCAAPRPAAADQGFGSRDSYQGFGGRDSYQPRGRSALEHRPGDWTCPDCKAHNFANKVACYRCSFPRPQDAEMPGGMVPGSQRYNSKPGDWGCAECGANNFAWRNDCFKCAAPRSDDAPVVPQSGFRDRGSFFDRASPRNPRGGGAREVRPGDWSCPECNAHNFSSKTSCYRCGIPKPPGSEMSPTSETSDYRAGGFYGGRDAGRTQRSYEGRGSYGRSSSDWAGSSEQPKAADLDW